MGSLPKPCFEQGLGEKWGIWGAARGNGADPVDVSLTLAHESTP